MKLTALAFHVMALAQCLRDFPRFNASLSPDGKVLVLKDYVYIGIAVDTPHGLMVPVIRNADQKGLWQISAEISDLVTRAQARKIKPTEDGVDNAPPQKAAECQHVSLIARKSNKPNLHDVPDPITCNFRRED